MLCSICSSKRIAILSFWTHAFPRVIRRAPYHYKSHRFIGISQPSMQQVASDPLLVFVWALAFVFCRAKLYANFVLRSYCFGCVRTFASTSRNGCNFPIVFLPIHLIAGLPKSYGGDPIFVQSNARQQIELRSRIELHCLQHQSHDSNVKKHFASVPGFHRITIGQFHFLFLNIR